MYKTVVCKETVLGVHGVAQSNAELGSDLHYKDETEGRREHRKVSLVRR